jgi:serine phosphatase RsbU (regulator of sigma subunit)
MSFMELQIGVAKIKKYASSESGDSVELVERPNGGISIVMADGQRSGKSAKRISNMVVRKVVSLLAEGIRDGAAARAASDYLYTERAGKVLATLNIISIDDITNSIVVTRNNPAPILYRSSEEIQILDEDCDPVGVYRNTRPLITEIPITEGLCIIAFTDGITNAGVKKSESLDIKNLMEYSLKNNMSAQETADFFMNKAIELDNGFPVDDISIVAVKIFPEKRDDIRRLTLSTPIIKK